MIIQMKMRPRQLSELVPENSTSVTSTLVRKTHTIPGTLRYRYQVPGRPIHIITQETMLTTAYRKPSHICCHRFYTCYGMVQTFSSFQLFFSFIGDSVRTVSDE